MPELEDIPKRDFSSGLKQNVDNTIVSQNSVRFSQNLWFHEVLGRAVLREGTSLVGSQIQDGKTCLGLHNFIKSNGNKWPLAVFNDSGDNNAEIHRFDNGSWSATETSTFSAGTKIRFFTYLDEVCALNGTDGPLTSSDGSTWNSTGGNLDVGNMPNGKFGIEWHDKIHIAGISGKEDTIEISSLPDNSNNISWASSDGADSIQIEPFEGQGTITGLGKVPGYLLIFKERALKRWNGNSTFPDDLHSTGTTSHDSIVNTGQTTMYFSASRKGGEGFYETNGETVQKISRPVQKVIDAISTSQYSDIAGFGGKEFAIWSIGDITFEDFTYNNACLMYHIDTKTWSFLNFPTQYHFFSEYIDGSTIKMMAGNDNGEVMEIFDGSHTDDNTDTSGKDIPFALQTHPNELQSRADLNSVQLVHPFTRKGEGTQVSIRKNERFNNAFESRGVVKSDLGSEIGIMDEFKTIEFRFSGTSSSKTEIVGYNIVMPKSTNNPEEN